MMPSAVRSQEALKSAPPLRLTCGLHHRAKYANGTGGYLPMELVEDPEATGFTMKIMSSTGVHGYIFLHITHQLVPRKNAFTPRNCEYGR